MESKVLLPQEMAVESGTFVSPLKMTSSPTTQSTSHSIAQLHIQFVCIQKAKVHT